MYVPSPIWTPFVRYLSAFLRGMGSPDEGRSSRASHRSAIERAAQEVHGMVGGCIHETGVPIVLQRYLQVCRKCQNIEQRSLYSRGNSTEWSGTGLKRHGSCS